jgi:3-dehydroquinate synthase
VAHAIERVSDYTVLHGNAVAIGLVVEALLAHRLGLAERALAPTIRLALERFDRPTALDVAWDDETLIDAMTHDKKSRSESLRFALPTKVGSMAGEHSNWTVPVSRETVETVLSTSRSSATLY